MARRNWTALANTYVGTLEKSRHNLEEREFRSHWHTHEMVWAQCTKCKATLALDLLCLDGHYDMTYDQNRCHNHRPPDTIIHDGLDNCCGGRVIVFGGRDLVQAHTGR